MQRFAGYTTATIFLAFLTLVAGRLGAAPINYILLPGSTITPVNGASPTGPTEDLTGSFTWQLVSDYVFQCTSLNFQSASTTFTLSTQYGGDSSIDTGNSTAFFNHALADTGLWTPQVYTFSGWQAYQGPPDAPTSLDFAGMGLAPEPSGGAWAGRMTIVAAEALPGDANLDGTVDINDLTIVLSHFGQSVGAYGWSSGDFTGDGVVDINDLTIVLSNFGQSLTAPAGAASAVPEPAAMGLLSLAAAGLLAYACRRRAVA